MPEFGNLWFLSAFLFMLGFLPVLLSGGVFNAVCRLSALRFNTPVRFRNRVRNGFSVPFYLQIKMTALAGSPRRSTEQNDDVPQY